MNGIVSYGAYLPHYRLHRKALGEALGAPPGSGTRAVASYDEDPPPMGGGRARIALRSPAHGRPEAVYFATAAPAYLDKTNATAIHAALALDATAMAFDMLGSVRSGAGGAGAPLAAPPPHR